MRRLLPERRQLTRVVAAPQLRDALRIRRGARAEQLRELLEVVSCPGGETVMSMRAALAPRST
jgi:hypothetical protein